MVRIAHQENAYPGHFRRMITEARCVDSLVSSALRLSDEVHLGNSRDSR